MVGILAGIKINEHLGRHAENEPRVGGNLAVGYSIDLIRSMTARRSICYAYLRLVRLCCAFT